MLKLIKTRLEGTKGIWPDELPSVFWAYRTTARTPTGETLFHLAFRSEVVILVKVEIESHKIAHHDKGKNEKGIRLHLDLRGKGGG